MFTKWCNELNIDECFCKKKLLLFPFFRAIAHFNYCANENEPFLDFIFDSTKFIIYFNDLNAQPTDYGGYLSELREKQSCTPLQAPCNKKVWNLENCSRKGRRPFPTRINTILKEIEKEIWSSCPVGTMELRSTWKANKIKACKVARARVYIRRGRGGEKENTGSYYEGQ